MKLLFLTVIPSPYQRQLFAALDALPDIELSVFYYRAHAHDRSWVLPDLHPFETILDGRTFTRLGPSAHWNPQVMAEIDRVAPDLVIVSDYSALTAQWVMRRLARRGQPFVFWGEVPGFSSRGALGTQVRRWLQAPLRQARAIVGIGAQATRAYERLCPGLPVHNIPYYCDLTPYRQAAAARAPGSDHIDILFSGQMIQRKGVDLLLEAFRRIADRHPALRLLLLGDGPEKARYQAMVPPDLSQRVLFLGHMPPEALPARFAQADIFCLPSRHDGWGVVVNEALGAGLPIVTTKTVGAGADIVTEGENGFIVPVDDAAALAHALERIAGDDRLRAAMAAAARTRAAQWDVEEGARRWRHVAHTLLTRQDAA